jgi:hypothetical protein
MRVAIERTAWCFNIFVYHDSCAAPDPSDTTGGTSTGSSNLFATTLLLTPPEKA